jgi:hypothetical protein
MSSAAAHNYLVGPLNDPEPIDVTGLNSTFRSTFYTNRHSTPTNVPPPLTAAPPRRRASNPSPRAAHPGSHPRRARGRTVTARPTTWMGPTAIPASGLDTIDRLDGAGAGYHHDGPYDATLLANNAVPGASPVAALAGTTAAALAATPREKVADAVESHRPLDGVADVAAGGCDRFGRWYDYSELDLMAEGDGGLGKVPGEVSDFSKEIQADRQAEKEKLGRFREASSDDIPPQSPKWIGVENESDEELKVSLRRNSIRGLKKIIALGRKVSVKRNHGQE